MPNLQLGKTLVIANPTSHSGRGKKAAARVQRFFQSYTAVCPAVELVLTKAPLDAYNLARGAASYDTVIALGGDGVIHEVVNGLMDIPADKRPYLAIVAMGSGNDFARTLGATFNNPDVSLAEIFSGHRKQFDLGKITNEVGKTAYFMETLSFGLDAAISVDTTIRRAHNDKQHGSALFTTSGLKIMSAGHTGYPCVLTLPDGTTFTLPCFVLVANMGPTYGGGFQICPQANPTDGKLSLCFNTKKPSIPKLLALFGLAKLGKHIHSRIIQTCDTNSFHVEFTDHDVPCQIDGEVFNGYACDVSCVPAALKVIVPARCRW